MHLTQRLFAIAMLTVLPLLSQSAHATVATPSQKEVIERFIAYSSFATQFEHLPQLVREQMERDLPQTLSSARYKNLTNLLLGSFEADKTRNAMEQHLNLTYDNGRFRVILQKLESPLIRKLRDMEQAGYEPVARYEMAHYISRLPQNPPNPRREALIKKLLSANGAIDNTIKTQTTLYELMQGLTGAEQNRVSINNTLEQSLRLTETLRPKVEAEALARALYIYRSATDEELQQYIDFYTSDAGQWFKITQQSGWIGALRNIGRDIAWKMQHPDQVKIQTAREDEELEL